MLGSAKRQRLQPSDRLISAVARSFKGGLNTYDPPLTMPSIYITEGTNVYPDPNGALRVRFGTSLFADFSTNVDAIVGMEYYINVLVCVMGDGTIWTVNSSGTMSPIWSHAIAYSKVGQPTGWTSGIKTVSFAQFGGSLIICNGVDKPLIVSPTLSCNYLADLGSNTNVNVPRAKFCVTHNNYLVLAWTTTDQTTLWISSKGTSGTFKGDPAPNDGITFATNTYLVRGVAEITGLASFRDKLIVTYDENIMAISLGVYDGTTHVPTVDDTIENHGAVSHKAIVPTGDDLLFLDKVGIASIQRAIISATLTPTRESALVARDLQKALSAYSTAQLQNDVFAIHDRIQSQLLFFIPQSYLSTYTYGTQDNAVHLSTTDKGSQVTLSYNDTFANAVTPTGAQLVRGNAASSHYNGKWYWQVTFGSTMTASRAGFCLSNALASNLAATGPGGVVVSFSGTIFVNGTNVGTLGAMAGKLLDIAVDYSSQLFWVRAANADGSSPGSWNASGTANPATSTGGLSYSTVGTNLLLYYPVSVFFGGSNDTGHSYNFGAAAFAGTSMPPTGFSYPIVREPTSTVTNCVGVDNDVYVLCIDKAQKFRAMAYYDTMPYRCGARTNDGRIFLAYKKQVFYYHNQFEPLYVDNAGPAASQTWDDGQLWDDGMPWWEATLTGTFTGTPINFAISTSYSDMKQPDKQKDGRYLHCVMDGTGTVTIEQYNDRFVPVQLSLTFRQTIEPELPSVDFPPLNNDQLYAWPSKFTRTRLRVSGSASAALSLLSLGLLYLPGGYRR